jgi:membrane protein DedA with SNARE-associated domain
MDTLTHQAVLLIQDHHDWAIWIIFLATFAESVLLLGILIPGTTLLLICGGLLGSGVLPLAPVLLAGLAGAISGDALSYWIGRWWGTPLLRIKPLKRHRRKVAQARLFFLRYGFISIVAGRFMGPIRCTIPTVAGALGMAHWRFQIANILSAVIWVPVLLAPGYMAAEAGDALLLNWTRSR